MIAMNDDDEVRHPYDCDVIDCDECQELIEGGFRQSCEDCGMVGQTEAEWYIIAGQPLCDGCYDTRRASGDNRNELTPTTTR